MPKRVHSAVRDIGHLRVAGSRLAQLVTLAATVAVIASGLSFEPVSAASGPNPPQSKSKPNLFDPSTGTHSVNGPVPTSPSVPWHPPASNGPVRNAGMGTQPPAAVDIDPVKGGRFLSQDHSFEVDVPAGAVTPADVAAAGGKTELLIRQILPPSGSSAGGSGHFTFGTYLFQSVDSHGQLAKALHKPLQLKVHYDKRATALNLNHVSLIVNPPLPSWVDPNPATAMGSATAFSTAIDPATGSSAAAIDQGPTSTQTAANDPSTNTLTGSMTMSTASASGSFNTNSTVAAFGKPDPLNTDLNAGGLTAKYPLDLPKGPGGLTPDLQLAYSSATVSETHSVQAAAPWVGEGWSMTMGSISWAEHQVTTPPNTTEWEDSWQLNDPMGSGAELIPPDINYSTYLDDSGNAPKSPITWHTSPENRDKIVSFQGTLGGVPLTGRPSEVVYGNQILVFARGTDGQVWNDVYTPGSGWGGFAPLAGSTSVASDPVAIVNSSNQVVVFVRETNNDIYSDTFTSPSWSGYTALPAATFVGDPAVVMYGTQTLLFARNSSGYIYNVVYTPGSGWGSSWVAINATTTMAGDPTALVYGSQILLFAHGTNGQVWNVVYTPPGGWGNWAALNASTFAGDPEAVVYNGSQISVFVRGNDNYIYNDLFNGSTWSGWVQLTTGTFIGNPTPITSGTQITLFARASNNIIYDDVDNGQTWSGWGALLGANNLSADPTGVIYGSQIWLFDENSAGQMELDVSNGSWSGYSTLPANSSTEPPCFRVFHPDGIMEEFGCTAGSLQYYPQASGSNSGRAYIANWLLDLVTDPYGNQIHVTYQSDMVSGAGNVQYARDTEMATVEWDSPGCLSANAICNGSNWAPLMRVQFAASHQAAHGTASSCAANGTARCDDPGDLTAIGGEAAPEIQSTYVLNDAYVQVRSSGTAAWNTLKDYQFSYIATAAGQITDPGTGLQEATAGQLLLTQLDQIGDDGTTKLPARAFSYASVTEYYEDSYRTPNPTTNCGPSWNSNPCNLWSQSYNGNSIYLATADNGLGLHQIFAWDNARSNTHGVNAGGDPSDPLYCSQSANQTGTQCKEADDEAWSHVVLSREDDEVIRPWQHGQGGTVTQQPVTGSTYYSYRVPYPLAAQWCSTCVAGFYWGNQNDADYQDYYNYHFMGFNQATVKNPDGSVEVHAFPATDGIGIYDVNQVTCFNTPPCHNSPWWDLPNATHGRETELQRYATDGYTPLDTTKTTYSAVCPPSGLTGTPVSSTWGHWNSNPNSPVTNLVSELDHNNPVASCEIQVAEVDHWREDGSSNDNAVPYSLTTYTYETGTGTYGRLLKTTENGNDTGENQSAAPIVHTNSYIWDDNLTITPTSATGAYIIDTKAYSDTEDSNGTVYACSYTSYDGAAYNTTQQSSLTKGSPTQMTTRTNCADSATAVSTNNYFDNYGNQVASDDADSNAGIAGHKGCTASGASHSSCSTIDSTYAVLPTGTANALNQATSTSYSSGAGFGFGMWPTTTSDLNGQATSYTYDALGRQTSETLPGEGSGLTTQSTSYTTWCVNGSPQAPCAEVDQTQRLNSTTTTLSRSFYDGFGDLVETRTPAPGGNDVVVYQNYDESHHVIFRSVPYYVAAYTGAAGSAAFSVPDTSKAGTSFTWDGAERQLTQTDPLSSVTTTSYSAVCNPAGTGSAGCFEQATATDALGHRSQTLADAFGRTVYEQALTGSSSYTLYSTTKFTFDSTGNLTKILEPDGTHSINNVFDQAGRKTQSTDPDLGQTTYSYDPNGNVTETVDARGTLGTVYAGYDGLNRLSWQNTTNSPTGAFRTLSYDSTASGNKGVGRLTGETFSGGTSLIPLSGSASYVYDVRDRVTSNSLTLENAAYAAQTSYDDAGNPLSVTYPNGDVVTNTYGAQGWLSAVDLTQGTTTTHLLANASYSDANGGPAGNLSGASIGTGLTFSASFDGIGRATDLKYSPAGGGNALYEEARTFDAAGNVSTATTTLNGGTDLQVFCYDDLNRLTWAGTTGTSPCGGAPSTTLSGAAYSQSYAYDNLGRLTSGPLGSYSYGDPAHLHAASTIGTSYAATYDAAGNETCRATASTCGSSSAQLSYGNDGTLQGWSQGTTTAAFLYDSQGNRVEQKSTGGTVSDTLYIGNLEEVSLTSSGSVLSTSAFYYSGSNRLAMSVNGSISYLAADALGTTTGAFSAAGAVTATTLVKPYGNGRYATGSMPTDYSFTGQHADSLTGLDYFNARYYDPAACQFTSADGVLPGEGLDPLGLSRYAYVEGNPVNRTDPSGHISLDDQGGGYVTANPISRAQPREVSRLEAERRIESLENRIDVGTAVLHGAGGTLQSQASANRAAYLTIDYALRNLMRQVNRLDDGDPAAVADVKDQIQALRPAVRTGLQAADADLGLAQGLETAGRVGTRGTAVLAIVGAAGFQQWDDSDKRGLTWQQHAARDAVAGLIEGGSAAALGTALGGAGLFCGPFAVACVPAGAVVGGYLGGAAGSFAKDAIFRWNPDGLFG